MTLREDLSFDGRAVIVTGGLGGLGAAYVKLFAARGALVLVNDLGVSMDGETSRASSASVDPLIEEVRLLGGIAVLDGNSVEEGNRIIENCLDNFGRVDVVINNAGILRDRSFQNMTLEDWDRVCRVHLYGAYSLCRAAWPVMRKHGYGRIINTTSGAALWGNFGQANYCAAKLGVHGLTQALAIEGSRKGIHVNTISPSARSRLAETMVSPANLAMMSPDLVSPLVAYLCHEETKVSGGLFEVGVGCVNAVRLQRSQSVNFGTGGFDPESVRERWPDIVDFSNGYTPTNFEEVMAPFEQNLPEPMTSPFDRGV